MDNLDLIRDLTEKLEELEASYIICIQPKGKDAFFLNMRLTEDSCLNMHVAGVVMQPEEARISELNAVVDYVQTAIDAGHFILEH